MMCWCSQRSTINKCNEMISDTDSESEGSDIGYESYDEAVIEKNWNAIKVICKYS